MKIFKIKIVLIFFLILLSSCDFYKKDNYPIKKPKLTLIIVIDQFAYHYIEKLKDNFQYSFKFLLENGIVYQDAYHPHAYPATPVGHSALSTGTYPKDHGFISSEWTDINGKKVKCIKDDSPNSLVFLKDGTTKEKGKSSKYLMVDTLADQFAISSNSFSEKNIAYAISYKDYAAIPCAGELGKAIWFDDKTGYFTTSKAYFTTYPDWIKNFNQEKKIDQIKEINWKTFYDKDNKAYNFKDITDYNSTSYNYSLIESNKKLDFTEKEPYELYLKTPDSNQLILDLGKICIEKNLTENNNMLLWISMSSLDKVGHFYGPQSKELIDMLYHLDKQIYDFINSIENKIGKSNLLVVLTSDHGVCPLPENFQKEGFAKATRIDTQKLIKKLNNLIEKDFKIKDLATDIKGLFLYLDTNKFKNLAQTEQEKIIVYLKNILEKEPGIKKAWTHKELDNSDFNQDQIEYYFKAQRYPGRDGQIIIQPLPYTLLAKYPKGTAHRSPYDYDTHIPLIIYNPNLEHKIIKEKVYSTQLAATLAKLLRIEKPSASTAKLLPGIFD